MSTADSDSLELTTADLRIVVNALELLQDKVRDHPLDPVGGEGHQEAYLARVARTAEVERILPKVRQLVCELERLRPADSR